MVEAQVKSGTTVSFDIDEKGKTNTDQNTPDHSSITHFDFIFPVYESGEMQRTETNEVKYDDHTDNYDDYNNYGDKIQGLKETTISPFRIA
ncbi:hypothetical protein MAR_037024 [Mya arenaria]|uniref:Uncharacterized protein n=1 Tax=Mya arenaria TaxID=6604 RepID=A0ABY7FMS3_MYAAR|nr:hypothetical protein MAR_037024 [Mya arenaria]